MITPAQQSSSVLTLSQNYFQIPCRFCNGTASKTDKKIAIFVFASYFTVVIPIFFLFALGISTLANDVRQQQSPSRQDIQVQKVAAPLTKTTPPDLMVFPSLLGLKEKSGWEQYAQDDKKRFTLPNLKYLYDNYLIDMPPQKQRNMVNLSEKRMIFSTFAANQFHTLDLANKAPALLTSALNGDADYYSNDGNKVNLIEKPAYFVTKLTTTTNETKDLTVKKDFNTYEPTTAGNIVNWEVIFGNRLVGGHKAAFSQEEKFATECPQYNDIAMDGTMFVRQVIDDDVKKGNLNKDPDGVMGSYPRPIAYENVYRVISIDNSKAYGAELNKLPTDKLSSVVTRLNPPQLLNCIPMAAPRILLTAKPQDKCNENTYSDLFNTAVASFRLAVERTKPQSTIVLRTGPWGSGAYGGNRLATFLAQYHAMQYVKQEFATKKDILIEMHYFGDDDTVATKGIAAWKTLQPQLQNIPIATSIPIISKHLINSLA